MKNQMTTLIVKNAGKDLKKKLSKVAKQKEVSVSTLATIWFTEKFQAA
jgi:hypothetical protein